jgi:hypothetical protein
MSAPGTQAPTILLDLPDDILICIFSHCDIETLFAARLVCTTHVSMIDLHVKFIAPRVVRNTFLGCSLIFAAPAEGYSLKWLRSCILAQLASVALNKDKLRRHLDINSGAPSLIQRLPDEDLRCYMYLWHILRWVFRPYRKPDGTMYRSRRSPSEDLSGPEPGTAYMIAWILQGSSWLNWYILSAGL